MLVMLSTNWPFSTIDQFHRHVAADGDQVVLLEREGRSQHVIRVGVEPHHFLAVADAKDAGAVVGAAEREELAVVVERRAVKRVVRDRECRG